MQPKKGPNTQGSNRKSTSTRVSTQQQPNISQNNNVSNPNAFKDREDTLISIVKDYLEKSGYQRSSQTFKNQKPFKRVVPSASSNKSNPSRIGNYEQKSIVNLFDKGNRQEFFKQTQKMFAFSNNGLSEQNILVFRRLEFQLNIYFCIYSLHPCNSTSIRKTQVDKQSAQAFKRYIDVKGHEVSQQSQLLAFFALPYIPKPQENPSMAKVFTKQWILKLKSSLIQGLREYSARNSTNSNKQNKTSVYTSSLHEIYDRYMDMTVNQSRVKQEQSKQDTNKAIQKYQRDIQELRMHNRDMVSYLESMQQNLKDLNEASKTNLVQSNRKWFQFSKQILQLTKKVFKGQNVKDKLQKYERFFGTNIDQLLYCTDDISLFQKHSYTQDHSSLPQRQNYQNDRSNQIQITPIDINKITVLFSRCNDPQKQKQVCMVLKALKDRLCYHKSAYLRRQVVVAYQRSDLCALKESNYHIQKKLILDSSQKIRQFYLRLLNYISTDDLGNKYLSGSQKLIQNLMSIMGSTTQDIPYRKHAIGTLQKLSYIRQSQIVMMSFGIIPLIFKIFRNQSQSLEQTTIQYLMGMIMNLAVRKQSINNFQKHKSEVLGVLIKFIDVQDTQIKGYVNGTLYVLLQLQSIKREALQKYKIKQVLKNLLNRNMQRIKQMDVQGSQGEQCVIRQYSYILQRIEQSTINNVGHQNLNYADDDQDQLQQQYVQDIQDIDMFSDNQSNSSQFIEGEDNLLNGEELLMKKYALLGPQAVRDEIINRSILDQTSRKSNNMTTSLHHSKRIDKVFHKNQRPETPSLLPMSLDLSITPNRDHKAIFE